MSEVVEKILVERKGRGNAVFPSAAVLLLSGVIGVTTAVTLSGCTGRPAGLYSSDGNEAAAYRFDDNLLQAVRENRRELLAKAGNEAAAGKSGPAYRKTKRDAGAKPSARESRRSFAGRPAEKTTLADVLRAAAVGNPAVRAADHRRRAATYRRAQAVSLPDPRVQWRYYVRSVETRTGPQKWALGLSQRIPWPGKLVIAGKIADKEALTALLRYRAAVRDALAETKEAYFELYYIDRAQKVTAEIAALYDRLIALAVGGKRSGAGGKSAAKKKAAAANRKEVFKPTRLPEVFRAESRRAQLGYDLILLKEMRAAEAERLRAAAGLGAGERIGVTAEVADPVGLAESLPKLRKLAERHNQELLAAGVEVERAAYRAKLARRAPIPDLTFGVNYVKTGDPFSATREAGKDPVTVGVGLSVPLWFPKYRAMAKEARENEAAAAATREARRLRVRSDLATAYFRLSNSYRLFRLYRDTLLPQARQALQSAEEFYRRGDAGLTSVLETTAALHNFELAHLRAVADFYINLARIERIVGTALVLKPAGKAAGIGKAAPGSASTTGKTVPLITKATTATNGDTDGAAGGPAALVLPPPQKPPRAQQARRTTGPGGKGERR